jgi:hypothetical protein
MWGLEAMQCLEGTWGTCEGSSGPGFRTNYMVIGISGLEDLKNKGQVQMLTPQVTGETEMGRIKA